MPSCYLPSCTSFFDRHDRQGHVQHEWQGQEHGAAAEPRRIGQGTEQCLGSGDAAAMTARVKAVLVLPYNLPCAETAAQRAGSWLVVDASD